MLINALVKSKQVVIVFTVSFVFIVVGSFWFLIFAFTSF